eukprot:6212752-Pleurochrysis_carterae.AAC.4
MCVSRQCRQGCDWAGEYSELNPHLTASSTHQGAAPAGTNATVNAVAATCGAVEGNAATALQQAEQLKAAGNSKFEQRVYTDALTLYTKARL